MDIEQGLTLGEIGRAVSRIECNVTKLVEQHAETRETQVKHNERLGQIEHFINNQKHGERMRAQIAQQELIDAASMRSISVKSLFTLLGIVGGGVGTAVAAYFKYFAGD